MFTMTEPNLSSGSPKRHPSSAMVNVARHRELASGPARQWPWTAATVGFGAAPEPQAGESRSRSRRGARTPPRPWAGFAAIVLQSRKPEQNARPAPHTTTAPISSSSAAAVEHRLDLVHHPRGDGVEALGAVEDEQTHPARAARSARMVSKSPPSVHCGHSPVTGRCIVGRVRAAGVSVSTRVFGHAPGRRTGCVRATMGDPMHAIPPRH